MLNVAEIMIVVVIVMIVSHFQLLCYRYVSSVSALAIGIGDSAVDVRKDLSTWTADGCCKAKGKLPLPFSLPPSPPPPDPFFPNRKVKRPPPFPMVLPAGSNPNCNSQFWFLQQYRLGRANVLQVSGGATIAYLSATYPADFVMNVTASARDIARIPTQLGGGISIMSDGSCYSGGSVHLVTAHVSCCDVFNTADAPHP